MNVVMRTGRVIATTAVAFALTFGQAGAQADLNARLHGDYSFTQTRQCVEVAGNLSFDPTTFQIVFTPPPPGQIVQTLNRRILGADHGSIHYNGDGTGSVTLKSRQIDVFGVVGSFPVGDSDTSCAITYTVNPDGSIDHQATCTFTTNFGSMGTVTGILTKRQIVHGNTAILHAFSDNPVIEILTITSGPDGGFPVRQRICTRSGISSK